MTILKGDKLVRGRAKLGEPRVQLDAWYVRPFKDGGYVYLGRVTTTKELVGKRVKFTAEVQEDEREGRVTEGSEW